MFSGTIYLAADHAGFEKKEALKSFLASKGYVLVDVGAHTLDVMDDYPDFVKLAAAKVSENPEDSRGIIVGGSGQGEAMTANRFKHVRACVYYGEPSEKQTDADGTELDMLTSVRNHNDANVLSLGGRFLGQDEINTASVKWLETPFSGNPRHERRIKKIDD